MTMLSINTNVGALRSAEASYSVNKSMETSIIAFLQEKNK